MCTSSKIEPTDLELVREIEHVAAVLIVLLRVSPDEADFFLESIPGFEVCDVSRRRATMNSLCPFCNRLERDGVADELVVVFKLASRQVAKGRVDLETPVKLLARW